MPEYTPTTEEVRREYAPSGVPSRIEPGDYGWDEGILKGEAEFDRWLADHDKEVAAHAWDEGRAQGIEDVDTSGYGGIADTPNPHRSGSEGGDT
jgi:hypothetical protein